MLLSTLLVLAGYLFGSISSAIVVCRLMGLPDPRSQGSGNPGATNVMRLAGKKPAAMTLAGDLLKGLLPVLLAKFLGADLNTQLLVALAAFLGHLYPIFFGFKGGKGIATAFGVLIGLNWIVALGVLAVWMLAYKLGKISSVGGLSAAAAMPPIIHFTTHSRPFLLFGVIIAALIYWRHRSNIANLIAGTEK